MALKLKSVKGSKGDMIIKGIDCLESLAKSNKIKYTITWSSQWRKHKIEIMGKKFLNNDFLAMLKEAIIYVGNAEGIIPPDRP